MSTTLGDNQAASPLQALENLQVEDYRFRTFGVEFRMGEMSGFITALPIRTLVDLAHDEIVTRQDYELDSSDPGQRAISEDHVKRIKRGLAKHATKLVIGCFTFATKPGDVIFAEPKIPIDPEGQAHLNVCEARFKRGSRTWIVDAQHREKSVRELWHDAMEAIRQGEIDANELMNLLKVSSVPVLFLLEGDRDEIARLFVTMASTRPISPSLIAVMDREQFANRVGLEVAKRAQLLGASRLAFQTSGATGDKVYSAAAIRAAAANIFIGFRDRTPDMREDNFKAIFEHEGKDPDDDSTVQEAADEVVELLDYAYHRMDGWRELEAGSLTPKNFRTTYLHGTPSGLYVLAGALCAARLSPGVDPHHVIDLLAEHIRWRRDERIADGELMRHPDFEGTLVRNIPLTDDDGNIVDWKPATAGGARTNYEAATRSVITKLIEHDPSLAEMESETVQKAMGLMASGRPRGRPRKTRS